MEVNSGTVRVRRLRNGDARTVMGVFDRLSERSRRARFNAPKPCLTFGELRQLASIDPTHYALVAYVDGDPQPVAIARFVRAGGSAEIAFAVADQYQRRGIGSSIAAKLIADARAAGITEVVALVSSNNRAAIALLRRVLIAMEVCFDGPELLVHATIA
jgi:ribosomal protein S18 acetylase RimI-like enzyme